MAITLSEMTKMLGEVYSKKMTEEWLNRPSPFWQVKVDAQFRLRNALMEKFAWLGDWVRFEFGTTIHQLEGMSPDDTLHLYIYGEFPYKTDVPIGSIRHTVAGGITVRRDEPIEELVLRVEDELVNVFLAEGRWFREQMAKKRRGRARKG